MRVLAPAKINLHLRVGPPRADGFHPLLTWMCTVGLFDTLIVDRSPTGGVSLTSDNAEMACDASNLVVRAAELLAGLAPGKAPEGAAVHLLKRIPVGAGLGGGSSDGARILLALNELWGMRRPLRELAGLAEKLGSDVPFFLHGSSAICRGRGEVVETFSQPRPRAAMLLLPERPLATAAVYRRFDERKLGQATTIEQEPPWRAWSMLPALKLLEVLVNDLEAAAFSIDPEIGVLRESAERILGRAVRMSGSGSSLFTLFDEQADARAAATMVERETRTKTLAVELCPRIEDSLNVEE